MDLVELSVLLTLPSVSYLLSHQAFPDLPKVSPSLIQKTMQKYSLNVAFWAKWVSSSIWFLEQHKSLGLYVSAVPLPPCWWQEAAAGEIQIHFLSAQCGLVAKILGLFKRLVAKQRTRESSRMALNPGSPSSLSGSSAKQGISSCSLFLTWSGLETIGTSAIHSTISTEQAPMCLPSGASWWQSCFLFGWKASQTDVGSHPKCSRGSREEEHVMFEPYIMLPCGNQVRLRVLVLWSGCPPSLMPQ